MESLKAPQHSVCGPNVCIVKVKRGKLSLQVLEAGQLEDLGRDGGQAVAVEPQDLQRAGQVGEAARLHRGDAVVVEEPETRRGQDGEGSTPGGRRTAWQKAESSHVSEGQSGEGARLHFHNVVVAEVQCFQGEEGPELLLGDPGDLVVCSENTDTVASINWKNTEDLTSAAPEFQVPGQTNSQVLKLGCGMKKTTN